MRFELPQCEAHEPARIGVGAAMRVDIQAQWAGDHGRNVNRLRATADLGREVAALDAAASRLVACGHLHLRRLQRLYTLLQL